MMLIKNEVLQILSGPATLIPLVHVPLLKSAPRSDGDYKVVPDGLGEGDLCHLYGDFSGYHLYMIASAYRTRIVEDSIDYFDKVRGLFSISISFLTDSGRLETVRLDRCSAPLQQLVGAKPMYPEHISVEQLSPGTPDALKFHFPGMNAKFRFSSNLVPHIPESSRFCEDGFFDLRIEYIGKAVGKNGTREIADRLGAGHSKESKILNWEEI